MPVKLNIPKQPLKIINVLENNGYEAFAVGGCVRDSLLGLEINDWDIATSALPEEILACFKTEKTLPTGIEHGTVTIVLEGKLYEVTTYRVDGNYIDYRRPESVNFTGVLKDDLARRDFTMNAIAYNPKTGIIDYYGGVKDIDKRLIRAVGEPQLRFKEDALRIMRCLRFASQLGFSIHTATAAAMLELKANLKYISSERLQEELSKSLLGKMFSEVYTEYCEVLFEIIPELRATFKFDQHSKYHMYDVFTHTMIAVENAPCDLEIRLALLLHDIGKPAACTYNKSEGFASYYGHEKISANMANDILKRLKYSNKVKDSVVELIENHGIPIPADKKVLKRRLNRFGETKLRKLIQMQKSDTFAKFSVLSEESKKEYDELLDLLEHIIKEENCFSLSGLDINGEDIISLGAKEGRIIGETLDVLLEKVINEELPNEKPALIAEAKKLLRLTKGKDLTF